MSTHAEPARELLARIAEEPIDVRKVAQLLDSLSHAARLAATRALGRGQQRRLYAAVEGALPLTLADLVPPGAADLAPVRHFGRNTLPAFRLFEKRFCRPAGADAAKPGELYGFNFQALEWLTGPGYFVASEDPSRLEVWIDYRRIPPQAPPGWPALCSNERGVSRLVYGFMVDTLRRVSEHVTIGSAARGGRGLDSWFVLCRQD